ncbi:MAG: hypothetical protein Q9168_007461, partial [Polycauliona sp. 1 TL-2023]
AAPASAEDRKAAAALSSLDAQDDSSSSTLAANTKAKNIDQDALAKAISRLELSTGEGANAGADKSGGSVQSESLKAFEEKRTRAREERERVARVKVEAGDVLLLVSLLFLSRAWGRWEMNGMAANCVAARNRYRNWS